MIVDLVAILECVAHLTARGKGGEKREDRGGERRGERGETRLQLA